MVPKRVDVVPGVSLVAELLLTCLEHDTVATALGVILVGSSRQQLWQFGMECRACAR